MTQNAPSPSVSPQHIRLLSNKELSRGNVLELKNKIQVALFLDKLDFYSSIYVTSDYLIQNDLIYYMFYFR